jgi:hypothetical protein
MEGRIPNASMQTFFYCLFLPNLPPKRKKKKKVLLPAGVSKSAANTILEGGNLLAGCGLVGSCK